MMRSSSLSARSSLVARLAVGLLASAAALAAAGCSGDVVEPSGEEGDEVASSEAEVRASCNSPRRYFAVRRESACVEVSGYRGRWVPEAIFADAPETMSAGTCAYRWVGKKYSRADGDALRRTLGAYDALAPACGAGSLPDIARIRPIDAMDIHGMAGSVGCDVCGIVKERRLLAVLPPDRIRSGQFAVKLSDGTTKMFEIEGAESRAVSIDLPALPEGVAYEQGRIGIY